MHIEYFIYFKDFSETLSVSQTAANFFMTPQGISRAIHLLEKEFGTVLIMRSNNGLMLTEAGETLIENAEEITAQYEEAHRRLDSFSRQQKSAGDTYVDMVVTAFVSTYILPLMDLRSSQLFPFTLTVQESNIYKIIPRLPRSEDPQVFSLISLPEIEEYTDLLEAAIEENNLEFVPLIRTPLRVLVSASSPLAGNRRIKVSDVKDYPIVLFNDPVHFGAVTKHFNKENIVMTSNSNQIIQQEIEKNRAITFMPAIAQPRNLPSTTILKPLVGAYDTRVGFLGKAEAMNNPHAKDVMSYIRSFFVDNINQNTLRDCYELES